MIKYMTPGRIDLVCEDKEIEIPGEALVRMPGQPDFVVYAAMIKGWLPPHDNDALSFSDKIGILKQLRSDLKEKKIAFEIEDEDRVLNVAGPRLRGLPNEVVPKAGWWKTPALPGQAGSRYFNAGESFPDTRHSDYGDVIWYFDPADQPDK